MPSWSPFEYRSRGMMPSGSKRRSSTATTSERRKTSANRTRTSARSADADEAFGVDRADVTQALVDKRGLLALRDADAPASASCLSFSRVPAARVKAYTSSLAGDDYLGRRQDSCRRKGLPFSFTSNDHEISFFLE
jgi:hypothetical protein